MTRNLWKPDEIDRLRKYVAAGKPFAEIATTMNRPIASVKRTMVRNRIVRQRLWTKEEDAFLRTNYGRMSVKEISRITGWPASSIYRAAAARRLVGPRATVDDAFRAKVATLNTQGLSDNDISDSLGCDRHTATRCRKGLGLPTNAFNDRHVSKIRENTRRQCEAAGLANLGAVRSLAYQRFAASRGWPEGIRPRGVLILEALYRTGPMSREELAAAIGLPWLGSNRSMKSGGKGGSYLAELMKAGLVVRLGRQPYGSRKGQSVYLYALNLNVEPTFDVQHAEAQ